MLKGWASGRPSQFLLRTCRREPADNDRTRARSGGAARGEPGPDVAESRYQRFDVRIAVQWSRG